MESSQRSVARQASRLFVTLAVACGGQLAAAHEEKKGLVAKPVGPQVRLRSVYLAEPIGRAHQITVVGKLGGSGQVSLNGNTCTLTQFGDPGVCTEIFFAPTDVKLVQLRIADPSGQGRRLFQLQGNLEPAGSQYFLIVPRRRSLPHRLVVDLGNDHRRTVTLEPLRAPPRGKPELCKKANYRARQADGTVTLFASGDHPTAGWEVSFEQLPIRIFPPQYRLVCVPPTDPAAQVITPFEIKISFAAKQAVTQVIVHDAAGQHKVPVEKVE